MTDPSGKDVMVFAFSSIDVAQTNAVDILLSLPFTNFLFRASCFFHADKKHLKKMFPLFVTKPLSPSRASIVVSSQQPPPSTMANISPYREPSVTLL